MWVFLVDGKVETIFKNLGECETKFEERYVAEVIKEFNEPGIWTVGSTFEPKKDYCRKLENWEIVLYKLKGDIPILIDELST